MRIFQVDWCYMCVYVSFCLCVLIAFYVRIYGENQTDNSPSTQECVYTPKKKNINFFSFMLFTVFANFFSFISLFLFRSTVMKINWILKTLETVLLIFFLLVLHSTMMVKNNKLKTSRNSCDMWIRIFFPPLLLLLQVKYKPNYKSTNNGYCSNWWNYWSDNFSLIEIYATERTK